MFQQKQLLFFAACKSGAILSGASEQDIKSLADFGHNFGTIFQLIDDLIDYDSHSDIMGKNTGDDFFEGKYTLPVIYAYAQSDQETKNKIADIMSASYIRTDKDFEYIKSLIHDTHALLCT